MKILFPKQVLLLIAFPNKMMKLFIMTSGVKNIVFERLLKWIIFHNL